MAGIGFDRTQEDFTLAWIDQDQEARNRAHELLDLFNQPGSRDEMGLGTIRDAFSNPLFPGTNTGQTRLPFWLIVPWVYRALEREEMPRRDFWRLGKERELDVLEQRVRLRMGASGLRGFCSRAQGAG